MAIVAKNNALVGLTVDYSGSARPPDVDELYEITRAATGSVIRQIPRAAERWGGPGPWTGPVRGRLRRGSPILSRYRPLSAYL